MKQHNQGFLVWGVVALLGIAGFATNSAFGEGAAEVETALPAATVTSAINTAVKAKAGNVVGVEIETENGVTKVEVEIVAADGKKYEVGVNASTGKVIAVEADDDENEAGEQGENEKE